MPPRNPADRPATEPRTEAGKALAAWWEDNRYDFPDPTAQILAIEAEAAPLDRDRLFDEIDQRFGRNVARFVDARLGNTGGDAPRAEGLDEWAQRAIERMVRAADTETRYWIDNIVAEERARLVRLSRPSDERVPESEEPR